MMMTDNEVVLRLLLERVQRVTSESELREAQAAVANDFYIATGRCIMRMDVQCDRMGNIVGVDTRTVTQKDVTMVHSKMSKKEQTLH
jgi:hypothetical protein